MVRCAGQWFCPCCVREGRAPSPAPNQARFAAPHPAVAADDYQRCARLLRAKDWPECVSLACFLPFIRITAWVAWFHRSAVC